MSGTSKKERFGGPPGRWLTGAFCALMGILCAMAFVVDGAGYVGISDPPASATSFLWSALALVFCALFFYAFVRKGLRLGAAHIAFGLVFGVVNVLGTTLFAYDTWPFLEGGAALVRGLLRCLGQGLPMAAGLGLLDDFLRSGALTRESKWQMVRFPRLRRLYRKHTALFSAALFALCWSPYLLAYYPGTVSWDIGEMLAQFFGLREMDTWHPVFLSWVAGGCLRLGRLFQSDNLGMMLFTLLQTAVLAWALGYAVRCIRGMGAGRGVQLIALCFFGLVPIWGSYAQFICKDTLYTAFLLIFTLRTLEALRLRGGMGRWAIAGYAVSGLLCCLVRSNGLYVVLPTAVLVVLFAARGRARLRLGAPLMGAALAAVLFSSVLVPALGIRDETASGLYSVCFQQSARALRDHGDMVTEEEYAEIDRVLDAASLPEKYEPSISDPVKYTFKFYGQGGAAEKAAINRYMATWRGMFQKYPATYLEAFVAGNSGYYAFLPKLEGPSYNNQAGNRFVFETHAQVATNLDVHTRHIPALETARTLLAAFARGVRRIPLLSLLYACAAYTWLLVGAGISVARQRRFRDLLAFVPALLSLGVCLLSPVNDYFRYYLPIVAMALPLLTFADSGAKAVGRQQADAAILDLPKEEMGGEAA